MRKLRASVPIVPLPSLQIGLNEYEGRIRDIADSCQDLATRCLFLTQPSLYRDDLTDYEKSLLWFGHIGQYYATVGFVSPSNMQVALNAYNLRLLDTCRVPNLECFDLSSVIHKDVSVFYDDDHVNENGARMVADILSEYILAKPPFVRSDN